MQYAYITELEANSVQMDKDYVLRKKIIYNEDVNNCITAVYLNNHTSIRNNCKYNVYPRSTESQVTQYDDNKFYLVTRSTKQLNVSLVTVIKVTPKITSKNIHVFRIAL